MVNDHAVELLNAPVQISHRAVSGGCHRGTACTWSSMACHYTWIDPTEFVSYQLDWMVPSDKFRSMIKH